MEAAAVFVVFFVFFAVTVYLMGKPLTEFASVLEI